MCWRDERCGSRKIRGSARKSLHVVISMSLRVLLTVISIATAAPFAGIAADVMNPLRPVYYSAEDGQCGILRSRIYLFV
jgi:hypothetical protein